MVGSHVRQMRQEREWTLSRVSERTGIPVSALSKFERGKQSMSYVRLLSLAKLFGVELAQLFEETNAKPTRKVLGRRSISKLGGDQRVKDPKFSDVYLATDLLEKDMTPILCETRIKQLKEWGEWSHHSAEEFVFVVKGQLLLYSEMYAPVELNEGESIYFDAEVGHAYLVGKGDYCRFLSVCRP